MKDYICAVLRLWRFKGPWPSSDKAPAFYSPKKEKAEIRGSNPRGPANNTGMDASNETTKMVSLSGS